MENYEILITFAKITNYLQNTMGLPRFFPENKIHRFQYRPLFYDERKEELEQHRAQIRKELGKEDSQDVRILQSGTFKRMYERRMVAANDGNISVKINDNEFLCTPTGVSKGFMSPESICRIDRAGN